jgi:hypothetical protein
MNSHVNKDVNKTLAALCCTLYCTMLHIMYIGVSHISSHTHPWLPVQEVGRGRERMHARARSRAYFNSQVNEDVNSHSRPKTLCCTLTAQDVACSDVAVLCCTACTCVSHISSHTHPWLPMQEVWGEGARARAAAGLSSNSQVNEDVN